MHAPNKNKIKISSNLGKKGEAVRVVGAKGKPATDTYKLCGTYAAGYRSTAVSVVGGPRSVEKGKRTAEAILTR